MVKVDGAFYRPQKCRAPHFWGAVLYSETISQPHTLKMYIWQMPIVINLHCLFTQLTASVNVIICGLRSWVIVSRLREGLTFYLHMSQLVTATHWTAGIHSLTIDASDTYL